MDCNQPLMLDDLRSMRKSVRAQHPLVFGSYWFVMFGGIFAFLPITHFALKATDSGDVLIYLASCVALPLVLGALWAFRTWMMSTTSTTWSELFAHHHLQTFAGEVVTVELANWSGGFVTVRFADGMTVEDYPVSHLCNAIGQRHLPDADEWDRSLANMSGIRWLADGCEGIIRGSCRLSSRELPRYLIRLDNGQGVWRSFNDMRPVS